MLTEPVLGVLLKHLFAGDLATLKQLVESR